MVEAGLRRAQLTRPAVHVCTFSTRAYTVRHKLGTTDSCVLLYIQSHFYTVE